jgi:hypothetical protein
MARKQQITRLEQFCLVVNSNPGQNPARIARKLRETCSQITRALQALYAHGFLLREEEKRVLSPHNPRKNFEFCSIWDIICYSIIRTRVAHSPIILSGRNK